MGEGLENECVKNELKSEKPCGVLDANKNKRWVHALCVVYLFSSPIRKKAAEKLILCVFAASLNFKFPENRAKPRERENLICIRVGEHVRVYVCYIRNEYHSTYQHNKISNICVYETKSLITIYNTSVIYAFKTSICIYKPLRFSIHSIQLLLTLALMVAEDIVHAFPFLSNGIESTQPNRHIDTITIKR